jgi:hypothetical protein
VNASSAAAVTAVSFVWIGMVLAISFLEAPLKFRAPGVTIPIGLGIGRLVFRALNAIEAALAIVVIVTLALGGPPAGVVVAAALVVLVLTVQLVAIRPALSRRADQVLAGADVPHSPAHLWYVGAEVVKFGALIALGVLALTVTG